MTLAISKACIVSIKYGGKGGVDFPRFKNAFISYLNSYRSFLVMKFSVPVPYIEFMSMSLSAVQML